MVGISRIRLKIEVGINIKLHKMKKLNYGILILALVGITIVGCQKEKLTQTGEKIEYRLDNIPIIANDQDVKLLLTNPEDSDDEKINNHLYNLSLAVRELVKDKEFNKTVIDLAKKSETQTANLLDLKTVAPNFYDKINQNLEKNNDIYFRSSSGKYTIESIANDLTHAPIAPNPDYPETAKIEEYVPAIFVPNLDQLNLNLQPIISPNIEVDSNEDESIEDNIVSWYYTKSGELNEIILSEETSLKTSNPLFFIDNAVTTLETKENTDFVPLNSNNDSNSPSVDDLHNRSALSFSSCEHSIESSAYAYESWTSGKSEFAVNAYRIDPSGAIHWIYNSSGTKVINSIARNEIGSLRYKWSHHASDWKPWANSSTYGKNVVFWNTFERDWHRSLKSLGTCSANGTTIYLAGKMKYSSEWYAWIPETTNIHYSRFDWIYNSWAHWNNSWKSKFRLWRVGA